MDWIKKNWRILTIVGVVLAVAGGILFYKMVWSGNQGSEKIVTEVSDAPIESLSGHYVSSKKKGKAEIHFVADGTKEAQGVFKEFEATLDIDGNIEEATIKVVVQAGSVFTDNDVRDDHLNGEDFFHTSEYPEITFTSSSIESLGDNKFKAIGQLEFLGASIDFEFPFTFRGVADEDGKQLASFEGSFNFDHQANGMKKSGDADHAEVSFYVDMVLGGDAETSSDDEDDFDLDDEDFDLDDEDSEDAGMTLDKEHDDLMNKIEEEAANL